MLSTGYFIAEFTDGEHTLSKFFEVTDTTDAYPHHFKDVPLWEDMLRRIKDVPLSVSSGFVLKSLTLSFRKDKQ